MKPNSTDEIDLIYVYNKIKKLVRGWVALTFRAIDFIIKKWIIITSLIIIGVALGYFSQKDARPSKKANVLIRINHDAVDYVYNEVELLNKKIKENDISYFDNFGIKDSIEIKEIEITPIINLTDITEGYQINDRKLEGLLKNLKFNEDEININETFISKYKYHNLNFSLLYFANNETIKKTIDFFNNNEFIGRVKDTTLNDIKTHIANNKKSISQIDLIIDNYSNNESLQSPSNQIFVVDKNFSLNELIEKKIELQQETEKLNKFLVYAKDIVIVVNKPSLVIVNKGILGNKMIKYPTLLVFAFLVLSILRHFYFYLRGIAEISEKEKTN